MKKYFSRIVGAICDVVLIIVFILSFSQPSESIQDQSLIVQMTEEPALQQIIENSNESDNNKQELILFSQDIQLSNNNDNTNQVNCLSVADKDNQMKIALYSKHALSGFASILPQQEKGFIGRLELRIGDTLLHGECFYTNSELYLFEEASLTLYQFKVSMDDYLYSIDYEGHLFSFQDCTEESNDDNSSVRHYILV